jgi:hypothetical protein
MNTIETVVGDKSRGAGIGENTVAEGRRTGKKTQKTPSSPLKMIRRLEREALDDDESSSCVVSAETRTQKKSRVDDTPVSTLSSVDEGDSSGDSEWTGERESVFGSIPHEVLFFMMKTWWTPDAWYSTLLVCRRWAAVGTSAFNPFQTARSLMHGVFVDQKHLARLAASPRLPDILVDPSIIEAMCQRVKDSATLNAFITRGTDIYCDHLVLTFFAQQVSTVFYSRVTR